MLHGSQQFFTHVGTERGSYVVELCLFDLILYDPSTIFQLKMDESSWVEPVLS